MTGVAFATGDPDMQTVTSKRYVINELDKLQDKIPGTSGTKAVTLTGSRGGIEPTAVKDDLGSNLSDPALPNVSAVNTGLATKQNEIPAVNTNTVVTYTGTAGQIGQKGIYQDTGTYAAQSDNLIDAATFNESLRNGLNSEFICADYAPTGECWLWTIHNIGISNLFNKSDGVLYGYPTQEYTWLAESSDNTELSVMVELTEGKTYTATRAVGSGSVFRIQASNTPILTDGQSLYNIDSSGYTGVNTKTFVVPDGYPYVIFYLRNTTLLSSLSVEDVLNGFWVGAGSESTPDANIYIPQNQ